MDLLTINDKPGVYPDSWYHHSANQHESYPQLQDDINADVCIIGGGYTGLSTALHLAKSGISCVLLEANRVGWGASGRNGGQVGSGFNKSQQWLEKQLGNAAATALWELSLESVRLVEQLVTDNKIDCDLRSNILYPTHSAKEFKEIISDTEHMQSHYSADQLEIVGPDEIANWVASDLYQGGVLNQYARHLHPLNYALGLAKAARDAGVQIYENSRVEKLRLPWLRSHASISGHRVETAAGAVVSQHVVLACNGYLNDLHSEVAKHVMPINNYIVATNPLPGSFPEKVLANNVAVADSRFVVNYFRLSHDNRLLFGGGETWSYRFPQDMRALVRKNLLQVFPQLEDCTLDFAWGGTLAITRERLPFAKRLGKGVWTAGGYSGHGVAMATLSGKLISQAINDDPSAFELLSSLPCSDFPGGEKSRPVLLKLGMAWYALRDKLDF